MCTISIHDLGLCAQFSEFHCSICEHLREREQEIAAGNSEFDIQVQLPHSLLNTTPYLNPTLETPSMATPESSDKDFITITISYFHSLVAAQENLPRLYRTIEELEDDLDYAYSRFNWSSFLYGLSVGMALAAIPIFLILRHHNLLG